MSDRWRVGKVRTGSELEVADHARDCGARVYAPSHVTKTRPAGKRRPREKRTPLVQSYIFVGEDTPDELRQDSRFHDFLREVTGRIASIEDRELNALRAIERTGEPVRYRSGPMFCVGEVITVPVNDEPKYKAFGGMVGQVVAVFGDRVILDNYKFTKPVEFPALKLLRRSVYSAA